MTYMSQNIHCQGTEESVEISQKVNIFFLGGYTNNLLVTSLLQLPECKL